MKNTPLEITSKDNPKYKLWKSLLESRGIIKNRMAILSGSRIVPETIETHPEKCAALLIKQGSNGPHFDAELLSGDFRTYILKKELFNEIDVWNATDYLLLVKVPEFEKWDARDIAPGCTLFIPFQDPSNMGAVIRSASAFGVSRIVLLEEAAHPFHPKSIRSASGNLFSVQILKGPSIEELDTGALPLVILDANGENIRDFGPPEAFGLLCGIEGPGAPDSIRSSEMHRLRIPIAEDVESLNAAVATSIALFALCSS